MSYAIEPANPVPILIGVVTHPAVMHQFAVTPQCVVSDGEHRFSVLANTLDEAELIAARCAQLLNEHGLCDVADLAEWG
jgi:hypothetical protein